MLAFRDGDSFEVFRCLIVILDGDHTNIWPLLVQDTIHSSLYNRAGAFHQYDLQSVSLCVHLDPFSQSRTII